MIKRALIFVHRWLGVALCLLFLLWFPSGIGMMYWPYPSVTPADRLERAAALDRATIAVSPVEAYGTLGIDEPPASIRLNTFDGRPVYRFRTGRFEEHIVFADTAEQLGEIPMDMIGRQRWHMVLGLVFGIATVTWAFSGLLSMEPFPLRRDGPEIEPTSGVVRIPQAFRARLPFGAFAAKDPREALAKLGSFKVKELEFTSIVGEPVYLARLSGGASRIVPVDGEPIAELDHEAMIDLLKRAAGPELAEARVLTQYDAYYLDRRRERPLPVILARLNDASDTRFYIDPKTGRIAAGYSSTDWVERWVYHGLHSLDFPWLYNYRPAWDIVVITFMVGGTALCVTSLVLAWRVLGRTLKRTVASDVLTDSSM